MIISKQKYDALCKIAKHAAWFNDILSTAKDGGDLWCSVRNRQGASTAAKGMKAGFIELNENEKYENKIF